MWENNIIATLTVLNFDTFLNRYNIEPGQAFTLKMGAGDLIKSVELNFIFTVVASASPTVDLQVNNSNTPPPVGYNSTVEVSWTSKNTDGYTCTCAFSPANTSGVTDCGNGLRTISAIPISGIKEETIFKVECNN